MVRPPIAPVPDAVMPVSAEPSIAGSAAGNRASGIVPEARSVASKFVKFAPLIAGKVPVRLAAGRLVSDAPDPENSVAVAVPVIVTPPVTVSHFLLLSK